MVSFSRLRRAGRIGLATLPALCLSFLAAAPAATAAPVPVTWTDLVTPLQTASPRMRFHAGQVDPKTDMPLVLPALPNIPGPASDWFVAQWGQPSYLNASMAQPLPRNAGWSFTVPDDHLSVQINRTDDPLGTGYHLFEDGGEFVGGGSDLFLTATMHPVATSFANPVELRVGSRIEDAFVRYDTPAARTSGVVLAAAFVGTGALYTPPARSGELAQFVFVQLPVTTSLPPPPGPISLCSLVAGAPALLYIPAMPLLAFQSSARIQEQVVELQDVIRQMVSKPYPCGSRTIAWSRNQTNLANWSFTGLYAGLEVENRDLRPGALTNAPQGVAELGLEFTELSVRRRSIP